MNRLLRRRALVLAGCVFACIFCVAVASAAVMQMTTQGTGSRGICASSDLQWAASSGDMKNTTLSPGQETLTGAYSGFALTQGQSSIQSARVLDQSSIIQFQAEQHVQAEGPGSTGETYALWSVGAPGEATCGNITTEFVPYCETAVATSLLQGDGLKYDGQGAISQADDVIPDSFQVAMTGTGDGMGILSFATVSRAGIDNSTALGYTNAAHQEIIGFGQFNIGQTVDWTSFKNTFDTPLVEETAPTEETPPAEG